MACLILTICIIICVIGPITSIRCVLQTQLLAQIDEGSAGTDWARPHHACSPHTHRIQIPHTGHEKAELINRRINFAELNSVIDSRFHHLCMRFSTQTLQKEFQTEPLPLIDFLDSCWLAYDDWVPDNCVDSQFQCYKATDHPSPLGQAYTSKSDIDLYYILNFIHSIIVPSNSIRLMAVQFTWLTIKKSNFN